MKKFLRRFKKTVAYYKMLKNCEKNSSKKETAKIIVRPDYYAFLTCPRPVLESEKSN